jgi:hypothetical protein
MNVRRRTVGRRAGAALLLCGPLVAGCGTAARLDFAPHDRPAAPIDVSVYVGSRGLRLDPRSVRPGPVQFDVTNQSGTAVAMDVTIVDGRTLSRIPRIPPGGTAQLKTDLGAYQVGIRIVGRPTTLRSLHVGGIPRSGNRALLLP